MVHLKVVGRREEPATVLAATAPGTPPSTVPVTKAALLAVSVDEEGNAISPGSDTAASAQGQTIVIPVPSLESIAELVTGQVYALTPVL